MRTIHLRYLVAPEPLVTELLTLFPNWDGVTRDITGVDKHAYYKTEYDPLTGLPTSYDVYLLVPDEFELPLTITAQVMGPEAATHYFMGHEETPS
jgi:hypothetical protein